MRDRLYIDIPKDWIYDKSKTGLPKCGCKYSDDFEHCFCPRCMRVRSKYCSICGTRKCISCKRTFCQYCGQNMYKNTERIEMCLKCGCQPTLPLKDVCITELRVKDPVSENVYEISDDKLIFKDVGDDAEIQFTPDELNIFTNFVKTYILSENIIIKLDTYDY